MVASGQFEITVSEVEENEKVEEEGQPQEEAEKSAAPQRSGHRRDRSFS